jgi:O-antigen/teichoic acid export membrane protein
MLGQSGREMSAALPEQNEERGGSIVQETSGRRVLRSSAWLLLPKSVAAILSLIYLAMITRTLGAAQFGEFALMFSFIQMICALASLQTWQIMIRYGTRLVQRQDRAAMARLTWLCIGLDLAALLIACSLAAFALWMLAAAMGWGKSDCLAILFLTAMFIVSARSTPTGLLRVNDHFREAAIPDTLVPVVRFVGTICVIAVAPSILNFLIVWIASEFVAAILMWVVALRIVRLPLNRNSLIELYRARGEFDELLPFTGWTKLGGLLSTQTIVVIVGYFAGPLFAGFFRLGDQLGQVIARIADAVTLAIYTEYARIAHRGDRERAENLIAQTTRSALVAALLIGAVLVIGGKPILSTLFGPQFVGAYPFLLCLGGAAGIKLAAIGLEPALLAQGRAKVVALCNLASSTLLVCVLLLLVPRVGSMGAAIAVLASACFTVALFVVVYRRQFSRNR